MAQTLAPYRRSRGRPVLAAKSCIRWRTPPPTQSGLWYDNREGPRKIPNDSTNHGRDTWDDPLTNDYRSLTLPNKYAVRYRDYHRDQNRTRQELALIARTEDVPKKRKRESTKNLRRPGLDKSAISKLPTELLVQILEFIIPTGRCIHLSPTRCNRGVGRAVSVHQVVRPDHPDPGVGLLSIALTSKRLRDVAYGIFYGRNQFVIELATTSLTSEVRIASDASITTDECIDKYGEDGEDWHLSWSRIFSPRAGAPSAFYPLTPSTLSYVTDLTLCVSLSSRTASGQERKELVKQVESIADVFVEGQHSLRHLTVSLDVVERLRDRFIGKQLQLYGKPLRMGLRDRLEMAKVQTTARRAMLDDRVARHLFRLRGVSEVVVGGVLSEGFEAELRESVMRP